MILGAGIDIVELKRIDKAIQKEAFLKRVYSDIEINYCYERKAQATESFAGRFAAKEAVLKAFGTGLRDGRLTDIEIVNNELGCPQVRLYGYFKEFFQKLEAKHIFVSISHTREHAVAQCIIEA